MQAVTISQITPPELETLIENSVRKIFLENPHSKKNDESKPLRLEAAAEYLGIAKKSLYGLIYKGKIKPLKPGKHVLFLKSTLDAYLRGEKPTVTTDPSTYLIRSKRAAK